MTYTTTALAVTASGAIKRDPSLNDAKAAESLHVLAFSSKGHLLLNESQGRFDFGTWQGIHDRAYTICRGAKTTADEEDVPMGEDRSLENILRETVEDKIYQDLAWAVDTA
jgi:exosome complex component RRP46